MSDLIKKNLATFTSLLLGQKLEFDKNKGLFSISKAGLFQGLHRTNDDSINLLKLQIIKVFQEAEKKISPSFMPYTVLIRFVSPTGIMTLKRKMLMR